MQKGNEAIRCPFFRSLETRSEKQKPRAARCLRGFLSMRIETARLALLRLFALAEETCKAAERAEHAGQIELAFGRHFAIGRRAIDDMRPLDPIPRLFCSSSRLRW